MDLHDDVAERKVAIIGLGYVGLPLAIAFSQHRPVMAFDIDAQRIAALRAGNDATLEVAQTELEAAKHLSFTDQISDLAFCDVFIVTVPTPVNEQKAPDFSYLITASAMLAPLLKSNDVVVYESTVYPGAIEEVCVPVLIKHSAKQYNKDFFVGYSPERVNPGDKEHRIATIKKITAGSTPEAALLIDALYQQIVTAGTHKASSIKVAEAAKVIENTQRDINIALINELAIICNKLEIDTEEVLQAAETKWNFLSFRPGLVGGHCIGVDPYYLTQKAQMLGYTPEIILAGRRLNDSMSHYVASQTIKMMLKKKIPVDEARILIMGITFKENCPDLRNSQVLNVIAELQEYNTKVEIYDPWVKPAEIAEKYKLSVLTYPEVHTYDAILLAVAHHQFKSMSAETIRSFGKDEHIIYDLKYILPKHASDLRL